MSLNRYRLRHQARAGNRAARIAEHLLQRPDRLIGVILLGNTGTNIAASALVTIIALRVGGERAILVSTLVLIVVVLIFAEVAPKTLAALNPPRYALPSAPVYYVLLKIVYPVVWALNLATNGLLRLLGVRPDEIASHSLSADELRTIVAEAGAMVPRRHSAFVIDEYGDVQGLITTQDILREIIGELATAVDIGVTQESDRSYVVDASANVRQLNRVMNWNLPTDGPKTLNGLIVEQLETIPETGTRVTVADYPIEILDASEHGIRTVRVFPPGSLSPSKAAA